MLHAHALNATHRLHTRSRLNSNAKKTPADGTALTDRSRPPDVTAELLLDIACQNKFTPLKGLGFPRLQTSLLNTFRRAERTQHTNVGGRYEKSNMLCEINITNMTLLFGVIHISCMHLMLLDFRFLWVLLH